MFPYSILTINNKTIVDHTSPALCTLITPFSADRLIPFAANAAATKRSLLLHDVISNWMIPFAANTLQCIVNGEENPQNCAFPLGFRHPVGGGPSHSLDGGVATF